MSKSVLISIKPEWVEKILSGEKTLELRKNEPQEVDFPFKCYIYCTTSKAAADVKPELKAMFGKVVGEFSCDDMVQDCAGAFSSIAERMSCVSKKDIKKYAAGKNVVGWHIANVKAYDEPKALKDFGLSKAPQSWGYVEDEG